MTDIEKEVESAIRAAAGSPNYTTHLTPNEGWTKDQWEQLKETLRAYGTITHYYDANDTVKFIVSEQGRAFLINGGFETVRINRKVAEAAISAADSARKSAAYAKLASLAAVATLVVSVISWLTTCRQSEDRQGEHTNPKCRHSTLQSFRTDPCTDPDCPSSFSLSDSLCQ